MARRHDLVDERGPVVWPLLLQHGHEDEIQLVQQGLLSLQRVFGAGALDDELDDEVADPCEWSACGWVGPHREPMSIAPWHCSRGSTFHLVMITWSRTCSARNLVWEKVASDRILSTRSHESGSSLNWFSAAWAAFCCTAKAPCQYETTATQQLRGPVIPARRGPRRRRGLSRPARRRLAPW